MLPPRVDLPASTCPMNIRFTCSFPYTSSKISSSTSAACSFVTASASRTDDMASAGVGLEASDDGAGETLPFVDKADLSDFSIALVAASLAPSSADGASFLAAEDLVNDGTGGVPMERIFGLGGATSPPIENVFTGGAEVSPLRSAGFDAEIGAGDEA